MLAIIILLCNCVNEFINKVNLRNKNARRNCDLLTFACVLIYHAKTMCQEMVTQFRRLKLYWKKQTDLPLVLQNYGKWIFLIYRKCDIYMCSFTFTTAVVLISHEARRKAQKIMIIFFLSIHNNSRFSNNPQMNGIRV
jgi:hypothetical protein